MPIAGGDDGIVLSLITGTNVKYFWKAIQMYLLKLKIYIPFNSETLILQFCPTELIASVSKDRCLRVFIIVFFQEKENAENSVHH